MLRIIVVTLSLLIFCATALAQAPTLVAQDSQYPAGSFPITASAVGTTASIVASLVAHPTKTTFMCGLSTRSNATAASSGNLAVTGTMSGTLNFTHWTAPLASGIGVTDEYFSPCIPASAFNVPIVVTTPAPGAGGRVSVAAWGYQR